MRNKRAFTLTELIIALGIVGTIAMLTVPSAMNNINKRILSTQIRNVTDSIQQLLTDQMVTRKTKNLFDTNFSNAEILLTSSNFDMAYKCNEEDEDEDEKEETKCWANSYRFINVGQESKSLESIDSIKLKNGAVLGYELVDSGTIDDETILGVFYVDVNGEEGPNIVGRDFYAMYLTEKGRLLGKYATTPDKNNNDVTTKCYDTTNALLDGGLACFKSLIENNWKMPDNDTKY